MRLAPFVILFLAAGSVAAQAPLTQPLPASLTRNRDSRIAAQVTSKVVAWRRDLHAHPELSFVEERTAGVVGAHLRALGLDVRTNVGGTFSVVGVLRGGKPGPTVALRADMDGLPVTERTGLPFASKVTTQHNGQTVGVMHACGLDAHTAILMSMAEVLASMKASLPGTIAFLFQAAEEGAGLQTSVSRNIDLTAGPAVLTVGAFQASVRENIIPDSAVMFGTFRTFNEKARTTVANQIRAIAEQYATAGGATATVTISMGYSTMSNDPRWFGRATAVLRNTLGETQVLERAPSMPADDFSVFLQRVPGLFLFLGVTPRERDPFDTPANHSPLYDVDEAAMPTGIKALSALAPDALLHGVPVLSPVK